MHFLINLFCSIFKKGLEYGGLSDQLSRSGSSFTVFAPVDHAFGRMNKQQFDEIFDAKHTVKKVKYLFFQTNCTLLRFTFR